MKYDPTKDAHKLARELTIEYLRNNPVPSPSGVGADGKGKFAADFVAALYNNLSEHFSEKE